MPTCHFQQNQGMPMGYLKDFQTQINHHDYPGFLRLWEEYCAADEVDPVELTQVLKNVKGTTIAEPFGRHVEKILPLWQKCPDSPAAHEALKLIFDIQTSNHEPLRQFVFDYLQSRYGTQKHFNDKIRLIGLRGKESFQGAISAYELLTHMNKGNYVFHTGGWGVGEIVDVSLIREQLSIEFDYVPGRKDLSFANAFKTLIPIPNDHFLALRFGSPDLLEQKARENPAEVIRMLLRDLGPKTAAEIKDELADLVIPSAEWTRWWQGARAKVKKDTMIEVPEDLRDPFILRQSEVSHEDKFQKALETKPDPQALIQMVYSFMKDFSETLKNSEFKESIQAKLKELLTEHEISHAQEIQVHFFLQDLNGEKNYSAAELIKRLTSIEDVIQAIEIIAFKKRALVEVRKARADWQSIFLNLLFTIDQAPIRDYILAELSASSEAQGELKKKLEELVSHPHRYPDAFLWYFQKIMGGNGASTPFADQKGKSRLFEGLLILLSHVEQKPEHKDLVKKIYNILSGGRYAIVREVMQHAKVDEVKEFLLLSTKCHSLSDHDIKILHSLAEVAHPNLAKTRKKTETAPSEANVIWTTEEGYHKLQARIQQIATVETVENAKEIEVARSHGDLRENAEFKAALERRDRLQSELKLLSDQLNKARIFTREDIAAGVVGVGTIVGTQNQAGEVVTYTLLGPWDANPEKHILSFQSKLAQAMKGLSVGEKFKFQGEEFTITGIRSYFDKK
jgi:transcription elongation factor GreA-like protein/transcription elongation GreA/GreB family factor